jgi:hypothetical protein
MTATISSRVEKTQKKFLPKNQSMLGNAELYREVLYRGDRFFVEITMYLDGAQFTKGKWHRLNMFGCASS